MKKIIDIAKKVFGVEAAAIQSLNNRIEETFVQAVQILYQSKGRIIVSGMGKSGLIGKKIAATFASTGTPSFFLHPSEALHGDLGMLMETDCFLSISNSGETDEILQLLPHIQSLQLPHIALVGQVPSTLQQHADIALDIGVTEEASLLKAAPMASTITTLAMGDALAAALIHLNAFDEQDFARFHPGGSLGRKLVTAVGHLMQKEDLPQTTASTAVKEVIFEMSRSVFGLVAIVDNQKTVQGVITDGDLRRSLNKFPNEHFFELQAKDIMTTRPKTITPDASAWNADQLMLKHKITALLVTDKMNHLVGIIAKHQIK